MTLAEILAPVTVEQFLRDYVGEQFLLVPGRAQRFKGLTTWQGLNSVLSQVRVGDTRVRLVKQGRPVSRASYVCDSPSGRVQYLIGPSVSTHVLNGATLIVNQIDELLPDVRRLVESCEDTFEVHVEANLYAAWRQDNGFDIHWDKHDTLIVQVLGRKNWKIWRPTREHPLDEDPLEMIPLPTDDPVWEGVLEHGGVLYMPRGWWHVAWACDEPSLHITLGIRHPTGADLLDWVVRQLKAHVNVRRDVPHLKDRGQQVVWLQALSEVCAAAFHDRTVDDYIDTVVNTTQPRPIVRLPESTTVSTPESLAAESILRLVYVRKLRLREGQTAGVLTFETRSREWQCNELLRPALGMLHAVVPCTLADMVAVVEPQARPLVRPFVEALVAADVVWRERPYSTPPNADADGEMRSIMSSTAEHVAR